MAGVRVREYPAFERGVSPRVPVKRCRKFHQSEIVGLVEHSRAVDTRIDTTDHLADFTSDAL